MIARGAASALDHGPTGCPPCTPGPAMHQAVNSALAGRRGPMRRARQPRVALVALLVPQNGSSVSLADEQGKGQ